MAENTQRSSCIRNHPSILKSRKRKLSENEMDSGKFARREVADTGPIIVSNGVKPLEDVTSSLNVEQNLEVEIIKDTRAITPEAAPLGWSRFRTLSCYPMPRTRSNVPLPALTWADRDDVWNLMCKKDKIYIRDPDHLSRHPLIQPRMRAVLLDWLTEVSEVYKLHRESYYLAVDYMDRYFTFSENLPKDQLQLTGITCLFIAAKIEEIYPPKLLDFSYVTDGACTEEEILEKELVIVKTLKWDLSPITSNSWANTFVQLMHDAFNREISSDAEPVSEAEDFTYPSYSGLVFVQVARLLDLCILDTHSLSFPTSILAATALSFISSQKLAILVTGFTLEELKKCHNWMGAFSCVTSAMFSAEVKCFNQVAADDVHNIQTHAVTLENLDKAHSYLSRSNRWRRSSPVSEEPPDVLTPPKTIEKCYSVWAGVPDFGCTVNLIG